MATYNRPYRHTCYRIGTREGNPRIKKTCSKIFNIFTFKIKNRHSLILRKNGFVLILIFKKMKDIITMIFKKKETDKLVIQPFTFHSPNFNVLPVSPMVAF